MFSFVGVVCPLRLEFLSLDGSRCNSINHIVFGALGVFFVRLAQVEVYWVFVVEVFCVTEQGNEEDELYNETRDDNWTEADYADQFETECVTECTCLVHDGDQACDTRVTDCLVHDRVEE